MIEEQLKLCKLVSDGDIATEDSESVYYIVKHEIMEIFDYHILINVFTHRIEFKVFEFQSFTGPNGAGIQFPAIGDKYGDYTEDIFNAQPYFEGTIKWDGCSNVIYSDQNNCMLHYCGVEDAERSWLMFQTLYKYAADNIPTWDGV